VTKENARQALDDQYGGQDEPTSGGFTPSYRGTKFSNAYMLVYMRESEWENLMCEVRGRTLSSLLFPLRRHITFIADLRIPHFPYPPKQERKTSQPCTAGARFTNFLIGWVGVGVKQGVWSEGGSAGGVG
jgi:hypothetical protein